ncbi:hypothetical protein WCLP8_280002 [uncultured Gammaproteobacteria bacterium]
MRGPAGEVLVPDFRRLAALGSLAGAPRLTSGTGRTLTLTGFTANAARVLQAGDLIQTSVGRSHMVLDDINADGSGNATRDQHQFPANQAGTDRQWLPGHDQCLRLGRHR